MLELGVEINRDWVSHILQHFVFSRGYFSPRCPHLQSKRYSRDNNGCFKIYPTI